MNKLFKSFALAAALAAASAPALASDYDTYISGIQAAAQSQSNAEIARLQVMADIAAAGDASTKNAALMAIAMGGNSRVGGVAAQVAPPEDKVLAWGRLLLPTATSLYTARLGSALQHAQIAAQSQQYETTMGTLGGLASQGMEYASKPPLIVEPFVVTVPAAAPAAAPVAVAPAQ